MSPPPPLFQFQAVILAGGGGSRLFPLNAAGLPKAMMPVANRPLLTFPLRSLEEAGISDVLVLCEGDASASAVRSWLTRHSAADNISIEVLRIPEGTSSVSALRSAVHRIKSDNFVLLSGDVVTEVPLRAQLLQHQLRGAAMTALFGRKKSSPAADTQPGKAPRNVDYVGLAEGDHLVYYSHSPEPAKELRMTRGALRLAGAMQITTRLVDMQVYVFRTAALKAVLEERPEMQKLEDHLVPHLVLRQTTAAAAAAAAGTNPITAHIDIDMQRAASSNLGDAEAAQAGFAHLSLSETSNSGCDSSLCVAYIAPEGSYCQRANTLQGYADVNREAVAPNLAPKLLREAPSARGENFIAPGVALGNRSTVGSGCCIGSESTLGDKCSVKRSVIGKGCVLGNNVKIINSVLMDGVRVDQNCHIQNSIVSSGCVLGAGAEVKDCQLGPGYVVPAGKDLKDEALAVKK